MDTPTLASNLHGFYAVLDRADADLANQLVAPIARGGAGEVPVVAIGGIGVDQVCEVYATGAAAICAISAVNAAADPAAAGRRFAPTVG